MEHNAEQAIYQAAVSLFAQQGWVKTRIEQICAAAGVSRVTFYKYHANKKALLCQILTDDKNRVRTALLHIQAHASNMNEVMQVLLMQQQLSLSGIYTPAMLHDISHHKDNEIQLFFLKMNEEKYIFMRSFFQTLQQRGLIRSQVRTELIDAFVRQLDSLLQQPLVQHAYADAPQNLLQDALHLLLYGLSGNLS